jgi:hypothetical protein
LVRRLRLEHWVKNTLFFVVPASGLQITSGVVLGQSFSSSSMLDTVIRLY